MTAPTPATRARAINWRRQQVIKMHPTESLGQMADALGVPRSTIESDCKTLGLKKTTAQRAQAIAKARGPTTFWNSEMIEILLLMYPVMPAADVAVLLGINSDAVSNKAYKLRLKKRRKTPKATQTAPPKPKASAANAAPATTRAAAPPPAYRGPPPMTAAQIAQREKQRITYPPDQLPWKARAMWGPSTGLPDLSHRSQAATH